MPISSHCFWPCDRLPARRSRSAPRRMVSRISSMRPPARPRSRASTASRAAARSFFSASRRLSSTVCISNTVGFWNLRPMPSSAICGLVELGEVVAALEEDVAVVGPGLAGDDVHHRGLAGAVRADDGAHLARLDDERQIVERAEAVERDGDAVEIEQARRWCACPWRYSAACGAAAARAVIGAPPSAAARSRAPVHHAARCRRCRAAGAA